MGPSSLLLSTFLHYHVLPADQSLDPDANFQKASDFIRSAAQTNARLAVLPEYHLTNWKPDHPAFLGICKRRREDLEKYKALARECRIYVVPGTIVEAHEAETKGADQLVNVAYFINHEGEALGRYEKKKLWHPERPHLTSSTSSPHTAFDTPIGKVGMLICWDLAFPEAFRELIAAGAKTIIIPTFWTLSDCSPYGLNVNPRSEALFLESTLTSRAYKNTCCVILVNAGGPASSADSGEQKLKPEDGVAGPPDTKPITSNYVGLSHVTVPFVGALPALGDETGDSAVEGMSIVDVDMRHVQEAEENYKIRVDIKEELALSTSREK